MKLLIAIFLCLPALFAQGVNDVQNAKQAAFSTSTIALTVTASQGDGTVCTLNKVANGQIYAILACSSSDGKTALTSTNLRSNSTSTYGFTWGLGDVLCLIGVNPTATASTMGSLGPVPANGIAWSCSTNIRVGGAVTGQTAPTSGSVTWP